MLIAINHSLLCKMYKVNRIIVDSFNFDMVYKKLETYSFNSYRDAWNCYQLFEGKRYHFWMNPTIIKCLITN